MKLKSKKIPFNEFLNRNKFFELIVLTNFYLFFFIVRIINRLFSISDGNVTIIALHRLGDTIFTIPAIREIKKHYNRKIIIVCFSSSIPIYSLAFNDVEFCAVNHTDFYFQERIAKKKVKQKLKSLKPYIIFDLTGSMISASLIFNMKAKEIIGINGKQFRMIYDRFVEFRKSPKLIDIYLDAISPVIKTPEKHSLVRESIALNPNGRILLHPYAGLKEKEWNLRKFISLAEILNRNYNVSIIAPTDYIRFDILQELMYARVEVIQTNSSVELIQNIKECSLFIGNDSGPVNIANFLGKPTFTIYSATNPEYTATYSDHQKFIQMEIECSARQNEKYCIIGGDTYNCSGIQCTNLLNLDEIYENVLLLVSEYCNTRSLN